MEQRRYARFVRRLVKIFCYYALCIASGLLLARIPAARLGLSETTLEQLCIFWMILGPIYGMLLARLLRALFRPLQGDMRQPAETGRRAVHVLTTLLLFLGLSGAQADAGAASVQAKGLSTLRWGRRYPLRARRFLARFLPAAWNLFLLEVLTLLVCIVSFAPLSRAASNLFLLLITLTALALLLVPLVLSIVSGYQGDRAAHTASLARAGQMAAQNGERVLECDVACRKRYLRLPRRLFWLLCPGLLLLSFLLLFLTRDIAQTGPVSVLRQLGFATAKFSALAFLPLLIYWANCSGTSRVLRIYLRHDRLHYTGYSGSMDERVSYDYALIQLDAVRCSRRSIRIQGLFVKTTADRHGVARQTPRRRTVRIPRCFTQEAEQTLLAYLQNWKTNPE